jgi:O-antigen/teichoic acid export membrane protein
MREALRVVLYQGVNFGFQILFLLLAARALGPEVQGKYAILRTCTYLIETFMWLGLTSGVTYFVAKDFERYHNAMVVTCAAYIAGGVAISLPLVLMVFPHFQIPSATGFLIVLWVASLAIVQLFLKIFLGQQRYRLYNHVNILTACSLFLPLVGFWMAGRITLQHVIYCNVFGNLVGIAASMIAHRGYLASLDFPASSFRGLLTEFYSVGLKAYLSALAFQLLYRADFFFVGYFLGARTLGIYSLAVLVVEAVQKVPDWLGLVLAPKVSAGLDPHGNVTRSFALASFGFVVVISALLGVAGLARFNYLGIALGAKYHGVETIVLALLPKALLHSILAIYGGNLSGKGYTIYHPLSGIVALGTLVACDSVLFHYFGLSAAIVGITISYCVATAIMVFAACRRVQPTVPALETVGA